MECSRSRPRPSQIQKHFKTTTITQHPHDQVTVAMSEETKAPHQSERKGKQCVITPKRLTHVYFGICFLQRKQFR